MKTVGTILHEARIAKGYSLANVEDVTKIRATFLEAIEMDDFHRLPSLTIARGFVQNYADFLGLDARTILAFFRRQMHEEQRTTFVPTGIAKPLNQTVLQLTPGRFLTLLVGGLVVLFLFYLGFAYRALRLPPHLEVESPARGLVTSEKRIEVIGKTDPDATVTVNGVGVLVRSDGRFFDHISLEPGVNSITIVATSRFGKTITVTRDVGYQP